MTIFTRKEEKKTVKFVLIPFFLRIKCGNFECGARASNTHTHKHTERAKNRHTHSHYIHSNNFDIRKTKILLVEI